MKRGDILDNRRRKIWHKNEGENEEEKNRSRIPNATARTLHSARENRKDIHLEELIRRLKLKVLFVSKGVKKVSAFR